MPSQTKSVGVRLPSSLKANLESEAKKFDRYLNTEIVTRLEGSFNRPDRVFDIIFDAIQMPKVVRIRSSSTSADTDRVITLLRNMGFEKVIVGARKDDMNNAVLVMLMQASSIILLIDEADMNMARRPREREVQDIFQEFDKQGILGNVEYCPSYLDDTRELAPEKAMLSILNKAPTMKLEKISSFLDLLSVHGCFDIGEYPLS